MLRNDEQGMIPHFANPYVDNSDQYVAPREVPEPTVLTMRDVDRMVRGKLDDVRREAREETRRECLRAWEDGRHHGYREGSERAHSEVAATVTDIIKRRLNWTHRKLNDRVNARRTTIQAEREFQAGIFGEVQSTIEALLSIKGTER